jgi:hypothetical protein
MPRFWHTERRPIARAVSATVNEPVDLDADFADVRGQSQEARWKSRRPAAKT